MFFMFHILVIPIWLSVLNSHSLSDQYVLSKLNKDNNTLADAAINETSIFTTHRPMVQLIQNLTKVKRTNLKSNVFDKMLAGEMFSIKQRFYDKDMTYSSPSQTTTKTNAQKPTLEIRQKWPIIQFLEKANIAKLNDLEGRLSQENKVTTNKPDPKSDKVVGVRSLPGNLRHMQDNLEVPNSNAYPDLNTHSGPAKICSFFKSSTVTLCSRHASSTEKFCSHSQQTRKPNPTITYTYYPIYYGITTSNPYVNLYYQDSSLDRKYPKQDYLYYEDNSAADNTDDYKQYRDYDYDKTRKPKKHRHGKKKVVINVQYAHKTEEQGVNKMTSFSSDVHESHQYKFMDNLENDLNQLYGQSVMKKCYCSSSIRTSDTRTVLYSFTVMLFILAE